MDKVVRQSLGQFGKHLAMRPQGRKVQEALDATLRKLPPGGVLVVDFDGVEMMDYSFSDEALGTLYSRMAAKEYPDRYLVLAVGDEAFQRRCETRIAEQIEAGATLVLVSHDASLVERTCERVVVLDHGAVIFDGPTAEGLDVYRREALVA